MRTLLIYPRYSKESSSLAKLLKNKIMPLGLLYVASSLEKAGHEVKIIDAEAKNLDNAEVVKIAQKFKPEVIGISATTPTFKTCRETAQALKKVFPETPIVLGGPHLASFPKISLEFAEIDFGVVGEGEITIVELFDALKNKVDLGKIKGIVFRKDGEIIQTEPREMIADLDQLPLPAWEKIDVSDYRDILSRRKKIAVMISSRGCPYNCLWCDPEGRFGKKFRGRSPKNLIKEIKLLYEQYNIREIIFYDDTFTVDRERIVGLCDLLVKENLDLLWECRTRVNLVDEELLALMKKAGCYRIRFGVESGNDEVLKFIRKGITKQQVRNAFAWTKKYGMETFAYFMLGLPTETEKTMQETIDFALEIDPDYATFSPTAVFNHGNDLFKWAAAKNYIPLNYWEKFVKGKNLDPFPVLNTDQLKKEAVFKFSKKAYQKFYLRPSFLLGKIKNVRNLSNIKKYLVLITAFLTGKVKV